MPANATKPVTVAVIAVAATVIDIGRLAGEASQKQNPSEELFSTWMGLLGSAKALMTGCF